MKIKSRGVNESILEITFFPETDRDKRLIAGAKSATLNDEDHAYFNDLLISICLNNNYSPIALAGHSGNSFLFRVANN